MSSPDRHIPEKSQEPRKDQTPHAIPVIGVGATEGGLDAFRNFLAAMPENTGMACVFIQHCDTTHDSRIGALLSQCTEMKIIQAESDSEVAPNTIYIPPPDKDIALRGNTLILTTPVVRRGKRLPVDHFLRSLAQVRQEMAICVVLSGIGSDGTQGVKEVKNMGGLAIAQSPKDALYDDMPVNAISTGLVDYVVRAEDMPGVLVGYIRHAYVVDSDGGLCKVLASLQSTLGYRFHHYKRNTLIRRIVRRMGLKHIEEINDYADLLRSDPDEATELFNDMLIGVTRFFREQSSWDVLAKRVIPQILNARESTDVIRVWVAGCSTGQEAYSMAMLLFEALRDCGGRVSFQLFASDIDALALAHARAGRYTAREVAGIPSPLLAMYFNHEGEFYTACGSLRDSIIFSEHDLISDPPFTRIDLVSCRNLLIYLQNDIQARVVAMFHFALNPGGFLFLGNSESIGQGSALFCGVSNRWRIFSKVDTVQPCRSTFPIVPTSRNVRRLCAQSGEPPQVKINALAREANRNDPSYTVVIANGEGEIFYQSGHIQKYLHTPGSVPRSHLFDLCRDGLVTRLRAAVHKCSSEGMKVLVSSARVRRDKKYHCVRLSVTPLDRYTGGAGLVRVCFDDEGDRAAQTGNAQRVGAKDGSPLIKQLEYQLSATQEGLQNTIAELETANEELKASNEKVMSMNEELQSANEELESSTEELQSLNQTLNNVNSELQEKIAALESTNNDLTNLMNNTDIALVFLNAVMHVTFFTPATTRLFAFIQSDIGRDIGEIHRRFDDPDLVMDAQQVIATLRPREAEIISECGEHLVRKIMPYRTHDNRIEGVVLTFTVTTNSGGGGENGHK